jgi:type IV pilus assembly protein PilA
MSEPTKPVEAKRPGSKINWGIWIGLIAIIGVIAAVVLAFNAEHNARIARAQSMEAVSLLSGARVGLTEEFQDHGKWPGSLDKIVSASGTYTKSIVITKGAGGAGEIELTATMRTEGVNETVAGKTIFLVSSDGGKNWTCKPGTMPRQNLPGNCRN